jgi:hypothetical protein
VIFLGWAARRILREFTLQYESLPVGGESPFCKVMGTFEGSTGIPRPGSLMDDRDAPHTQPLESRRDVALNEGLRRTHLCTSPWGRHPCELPQASQH